MRLWLARMRRCRLCAGDVVHPLAVPASPWQQGGLWGRQGLLLLASRDHPLHDTTGMDAVYLRIRGGRREYRRTRRWRGTEARTGICGRARLSHLLPKDQQPPWSSGPCFHPLGRHSGAIILMPSATSSWWASTNYSIARSTTECMGSSMATLSARISVLRSLGPFVLMHTSVGPLLEA